MVIMYNYNWWIEILMILTMLANFAKICQNQVTLKILSLRYYNTSYKFMHPCKHYKHIYVNTY